MQLLAHLKHLGPFLWLCWVTLHSLAVFADTPQERAGLSHLLCLWDPAPRIPQGGVGGASLHPAGTCRHSQLPTWGSLSAGSLVTCPSLCWLFSAQRKLAENYPTRKKGKKETANRLYRTFQNSTGRPQTHPWCEVAWLPLPHSPYWEWNCLPCESHRSPACLTGKNPRGHFVTCPTPSAYSCKQHHP